jgi:predicted transcriptional regulator
MPEMQPIPEPSQTESAIMSQLLVGDEQRPWSTEELVREMGKPIAVADAITALHAAGLIHRTSDGFLFPTRAAVRLDQLEM